MSMEYIACILVTYWKSDFLW